MSGVRHVWVRPAFTPVEMPGLILLWDRRGPDGSWRALVTWVEPRGDRIVTDWVAPESLRPVRSEPRTGSAYG